MSGIVEEAFCKKTLTVLVIDKNGGERGIRTLGDLRHGGFQDRCLKPLDHLSECELLNIAPETIFFKRNTYFYRDYLPVMLRRSRSVTDLANAAGSGRGLPSVSSAWSNSTLA